MYVVEDINVSKEDANNAGVNIKQNIRGYSVIADQISKKTPKLKIQIFIGIFFENTVASALKSCIINLKKKKKKKIGIKLGFFRAAHIFKCECTT